MAKFDVISNLDGSTKQILKDGVTISKLSLEQHYAIVSVYFISSAYSNNKIRETNDSKERRMHGMQSFIMCIAGLEAFANTFFYQRAIETGKNDILRRIKQNNGSLSKKIDDLINMSFSTKIRNQNAIIDKIFQYYTLRNEITHPHWEPSSVTFGDNAPITINGLTENSQVAFEDYDLCVSVFFWSLLLISRIGEICGNNNTSGFIFYWTGQYGVSIDKIEKFLNIPRD